MKDNKFTFFESYDEALSRVSDEQYGRIVRAICNYVFRDKEPELKDNTDFMAWKFIKPIIQRGFEISNARREANLSRKTYGGGAPIGNSNSSKQQQTTTKQQQTTTDKEKDKDKEMEWEVEQKSPTPPQLKDVVLYFEEHDPNKVSDAQKFFNHFSSLGWVKNGQPIVNWQSRADMWINEDVKKSAGKPSPNEAFNWKPPTEEEKAKREVKRHEDEYNRFKGTIDLIRENPQSLAYSSLLAAFKNGILDKYPTLKEEAKSLLSTRDLQ